MKNLIILILLAFCSTAVEAQTFSRGTYGTIQGYTPITMNTYNAAGTAKNSGKDTLSNADTGYLYIDVNANFDFTFDALVTKLTGTIDSTNVVLQACTGTSHGLTADWRAITGNTTYCATCIGASATQASPGTTKHYIYQIPHSDGCQWLHYRLRIICTGSETSIYTGTAYVGY